MLRRYAYAGAVMAVTLAAAGCGAQTVRMEPPETDAATAEVCADLVSALPDTLLDAERARVRPESDLTAAWGDPAIGLRCGVPRPVALKPDSYVEEVNGVTWLPQPQDAPTLYTAVGREAYVELTVPSAHGAPAAALSTVSDLIAEHVPPLPDGRL
ncbi:hypothetical protein A6A08_13200 [Nocardiopsis sp. TSRI0078]|uniref:DUF3515 domain-containing protein n=1 Tax=unclassified Nocardiopsis TaxID=2649073 RepID=UPI00093B8286|nr:DUF3515 domain-containing protein [Nocardiopsis sp. TSRI0078]OKI14519.1 hypothetical protein A6A08_13200 [Nocardiopsis sp. TSRI0078]